MYLRQLTLPQANTRLCFQKCILILGRLLIRKTLAVAAWQDKHRGQRISEWIAMSSLGLISCFARIVGATVQLWQAGSTFANSFAHTIPAPEEALLGPIRARDSGTLGEGSKL